MQTRYVIAMNSRIVKFFIIIFILFLSTCGSRSVKDSDRQREVREKAILNQYSQEKNEKYADLLVDIQRYTTNGAAFQERYHKYLIGIAGDITENKGMTIGKGSIGFYFDKKSSDRDRLYLGLDILAGDISNKQYDRVALALIHEYMESIMETMNSCKTIFGEKEVVGMVIGFKWKGGDSDEQVNIWIQKEDVLKYEINQLTFDELVQRSTVTNTAGKIIRFTQ